MTYVGPNLEIKNIIINNIINLCMESPYTQSDKKEPQIFKTLKQRRAKRIMLLQKFTPPPERVIKIPSFIDVIKEYSDETFYSHLGMKRSTFQKLESMLKSNWSISTRTRRPSTSMESALYMTMWYLTNKSSYTDISDRFKVSKGCSYKAIKTVSELIYTMRDSFIYWPSDVELESVIQGFNDLDTSHFPGIVGCVDCIHIGIPAPSYDAASYYNHEGSYSIILQGVCDSNLIFRDIFFGWPGRSHDASVWQNSPLCSAIEEGTIDIPNNCHLLGSLAYPLQAYMMVPYKDDGFLNEKQKFFNNILSSKRECIEQAFEIAKHKFPVLNFLYINELGHAKHIITACIALHNFIMKEEGLSHSEIEQITSTSDQDTVDDISSSSCATENIDAKVKRNQICEML